jgi:hypothetical protein
MSVIFGEPAVSGAAVEAEAARAPVPGWQSDEQHSFKALSADFELEFEAGLREGHSLTLADRPTTNSQARIGRSTMWCDDGRRPRCKPQTPASP